jgi:hypothetical protein
VKHPTVPGGARAGTVWAAAVVLAAILPYLPTLDDYFVRDDFGVVQLLAAKPAFYFPHWFYTSWMDRIWGFIPDEVRPFPALSYQLSALGGSASPFLHHAVNILIHAANGLLVMAVARVAGSLSLPAAAVAGLFFVVLPVHTESVAWITGRVDSFPAFFYLASFLMYARWRQSGSELPGRYAWSLALFFVALFSKQNTITMAATLVSYDVIVLRRPLRPLTAFIRPYVPFVAMTLGYLWLRYLLFGEVAREGALNARGLQDFLALVGRHLTHVIAGEADGPRAVVWVAIAGLVVVWARVRRRAESRHLMYFGPVWWLIGVAPILVAGYASPRHVYLAAAGWAIVIGLLFDLLRRATLETPRYRLVRLAAAVVFVLYLVPLVRSVREWNRMAAVSHRVVRDVRSAALSAPEGSLLIVGAPTRSWEWALPFAVQPPFTRTDLTERVFIVSPRPLSCCSGQWFDATREALRRWSAGAARDSAVALSWDPDSGALSRATGRESPQLPALVRALLDLDRPEELDRNLIRMLGVLPVPVD